MSSINEEEKPLTFEQALSRLETVVESMESEDTALESSIALYKEGVLLSGLCNDILNRFETEITVLQKLSNIENTEYTNKDSQGDFYNHAEFN